MIILDSRLRGNDNIVGFMQLCKALARNVAIYLARCYTEKILEEIGSEFAIFKFSTRADAGRKTVKAHVGWKTT